jgi:hypothetical protein
MKLNSHLISLGIGLLETKSEGSEFFKRLTKVVNTDPKKRAKIVPVNVITLYGMP